MSISVADLDRSYFLADFRISLDHPAKSSSFTAYLRTDPAMFHVGVFVTFMRTRPANFFTFIPDLECMFRFPAHERLGGATNFSAIHIHPDAVCERFDIWLIKTGCNTIVACGDTIT
jgi:hypothetical protein